MSEFSIDSVVLELDTLIEESREISGLNEFLIGDYFEVINTMKYGYLQEGDVKQIIDIKRHGLYEDQYYFETNKSIIKSRIRKSSKEEFDKHYRENKFELNYRKVDIRHASKEEINEYNRGIRTINKTI